MSEKSNSSKSKRKERGLNVKVTQEEKTSERESVRVNSNFDKKNTKKTAEKKTASAKKTTSKKTVAKKTSSKKTTNKKVEKKTEKLEPKIEKVEVKKVEKVEEPKPEEIEVKKVEKVEEPILEKIEIKKVSEKKSEEEIVKPASFSKDLKKIKEEKTPKFVETKNDDFETLNFNISSSYTSKIITRDVARERAEVENPVISAKKAKKDDEPIEPAKSFRISAEISRGAAPRKLTAKEIKEQEIKKAVTLANKLPENGKKRQKKGDFITRMGWARLTLMITCITTAVFALVYFVNLTSADMSLKVAASQSGIEATYPGYVPRGYELSDVTSASGKVTMNYKSEEGTFTLTEEATNWDSNALLNKYIKENYADDEYSVVVEQGLTIYMGSSWEAWVNGGILYKLNVKTGSLTKKQLKTIATSL